MDTLGFATALKIIGALVTFGLGLWIGLGRPGTKRSEQQSGGRHATLRATWMNRLFFSGATKARRLDTHRLVIPKKQPRKKAAGPAEAERSRSVEPQAAPSEPDVESGV